jgi:hypothetical protein
MRRPRRFTLPKLEEDRARAERAIQAVLGEPTALGRGDDSTGAVPHTAIDLSLRGLDGLRDAIGDDTAGRLVGAVASTIHDHTRSGDRTIDLGDGRFRLIVEADPVGAEAASERIRALTSTWLAASVVPVTLRAVVVADAGSAGGVAAS